MQRALRLIVVGLLLAACNPLISDPVSVGGEFEQTSPRYFGPPAAWLNVAVSGAPVYDVFVFALIHNRDLVGPTARSCAGGATIAPCDVTAFDVRMPNQPRVFADGSHVAPLMEIWSGETIQVVLVCVDRGTQELGCPPSVRTILRAVDANGIQVGHLVPGVDL